MTGEFKKPTLLARFACIGGVVLGLVMFCGCWYMAITCVKDALQEPDSDWGRSGARVEWGYAGLFATLSLAGVAQAGGSLAWFYEDRQAKTRRH